MFVCFFVILCIFSTTETHGKLVKSILLPTDRTSIVNTDTTVVETCQIIEVIFEVRESIKRLTTIYWTNQVNNDSTILSITLFGDIVSFFS